MIRKVASVTTWLALTAVLLVSGGHAVYYLLEWEWVRAQIAGIAFVAALVVSATMVVITRLRALEDRLDVLAQSLATAAAQGAPEGVVVAPTASPDPEPRPDFAWLSPSGEWSGLALPVLTLLAFRDPAPTVFIPVFLATGVAVSVVASGVEWVAAHRRPAPAPLPAPAGRPGVAAPPRRMSSRTAVAVPIGGAIVTAAVVGGLWLTAHYWSAPVGQGTTTLVLEVERNGRISSDLEVAEVMGRYCVLNAGVNVRYGDVGPGAGGRVLLRVTPLLDEDAQKRYGGCLEDAVLDRHRIGVTGVRLAPR